MTQEFIHQKLILRYLLGELSSAELTAFEEQFFASDELFTELQLVETDLIDRFVQNDLPLTERARFEVSYPITMERRQRVEFAKALLNLTTSVSASSAASKSTEPAENSLRARAWWRRIWSRLKSA